MGVRVATGASADRRPDVGGFSGTSGWLICSIPANDCQPLGWPVVRQGRLARASWIEPIVKKFPANQPHEFITDDGPVESDR